MRRRIVGLAVLSSVLAIALFGVPLAGAVVKYTLAYERVKLEQVADAAARVVAADLRRGEPLPPLPPAPDGIDVAVFDHHGRPLTGESATALDAPARSALEGTVVTETDGAAISVAIPVTHDGDVIGAVRVANPRDAVYRPVALVWASMLGLAVLAATAVWLLARRQAARLARPLEEISEAARKLGEGDFSVRNRLVGVTEIDAVATALNSSADRLDDLLARERAFSADASHQLRTPLAGLRLQLEAALEQRDLDIRVAVTSAIASADRLERTIDELLALARDVSASTVAATDLPTLIREMESGWATSMADQGRKLRIVVEEPLPASTASTAAARQILNVLVDNAVVHGSGTVTVRVREATDALAIDVSDEGSEITARESELFARREWSANGHGIGLALARRLAEAEGGRLRLTTPTPPTFTLLIPLAGAPTPGDDVLAHT